MSLTILYTRIYNIYMQKINTELNNIVLSVSMNMKEYIFQQYSFTRHCYGVVSYKASQALRPFFIYCASQSELRTILILPQELSGKYQQTPSSEAGRVMAWNVS
jgi:hypothetical protein